MSLPLEAALAVSVLFGGLLQGSIGVGFALVVSPVLALTAPGLLPELCRRMGDDGMRRAAYRGGCEPA